MGDGDLDLVGLNVGLNTKYGEPGPTNPAVLYFGDMDRSGRPDLIEAKCKSRRHASGSRSQLQFRCDALHQGRIFETFRDFASADLTGIYGESNLSNAQRFEADGFESGVWINVSEPGRPAFEFQPFPRIVQIAPCYDAAIADLNGDGVTDIVLVQNHDHREPETGLWRGGVGQMLRGIGDGGFEPVHPSRSGILLRGDGTGIRAVDVDGDGDLDLVATMNGDEARTLINRRP